MSSCRATNAKAIVAANKALLARVAELELGNAALLSEYLSYKEQSREATSQIIALKHECCVAEAERDAAIKERDEARRERDARTSAAVARTDWPEWWLGEVYHEVARNYPGDLTSESFSEYWAAIKRRCADAMEAAEERARESFTRQVIARASVATSTTLRDAITDTPNPEK